MLTAMSETDWNLMVSAFRAARSQRGAKGRDDRLFLEAVHFFTVHNFTWRALPSEFGKWNTVWERFDHLGKAGVFEAMFDILAATFDTAHVVQLFDSTTARAHVSAAGAKGCKTDRRTAVHAAASPLGYDAVGTLAAALTNKAPIGSAAMLSGLPNVSGYQGVTGTISYKPGTGIPLKSVTVLMVEGGDQIFVAERLPERVPANCSLTRPYRHVSVRLRQLSMNSEPLDPNRTITGRTIVLRPTDMNPTAPTRMPATKAKMT